MHPNDLSAEKRLELIRIVLGYREGLLADVVDPHLPDELALELAEWFERDRKTREASS